MDGLVGPYPEAEDVYNSRCPVKYVRNIQCPILFLHGKLDPVCPPNQATDMYQQLVDQKIPSALVLYENESHGWRNASTICSALNTELNFYGRIFKFVPDIIVDVEITNFEG
jgi:dipeptidyl aminopeptidase/acylaminoacyl peptidase